MQVRDDDGFDPSAIAALVLDANAFERGISLDLLRFTGIRKIVGVDRIEQAWESLLHAPPQIVLLERLDANGADALDFVRRVRRSEQTPNRSVPIFMLTALGVERDVELARLAGVDGYLRKPASSLAMQQRVRTVLTNPQPFIQTADYVGPCRRRPRPDLNYLGPLRRLDDVAPRQGVSGDVEVLDLKADLARAQVAVLSEAARGMVAGDAVQARQVYRAVQNLEDIGDQIGDVTLAFGAREMSRYLQAQGAERLEPEVVHTHIAALHQLAHLPHAMSDERQRVGASLKRMIDKKLSTSAAAG